MITKQFRMKKKGIELIGYEVDESKIEILKKRCIDNKIIYRILARRFYIDSKYNIKDILYEKK